MFPFIRLEIKNISNLLIRHILLLYSLLLVANLFLLSGQKRVGKVTELQSFVCVERKQSLLFKMIALE